MNKYVLAALVIILCSACLNQDLFNDVFRDSGPAGDEQPGQNNNSGVPDSSHQLSWEETFAPFADKKTDGANKTRSDVAYWSFNNNREQPSWVILSLNASATNKKDELNILSFISQSATKIETPPVTASAIFINPLKIVVPKLALCVKYYTVGTVPVELGASLLGPNLETTFPANEDKQTFNSMSILSQKFSFGSDMNIPKLPPFIHGLQLAYKDNNGWSSISPQRLRVIELRLQDSNKNCP